MDSNDMGEILLLVLDDDLFWIEKEQETEDVETV
jgi:hypothetical protein